MSIPRCPNPALNDLTARLFHYPTQTACSRPCCQLKSNTTYYLRAYAINANGTGYSPAVSFTTKNTLSAVPPELINRSLWTTFSDSPDRDAGNDRIACRGKYVLYSETNPMPLYGAPGVSSLSFGLTDGTQKTIGGSSPHHLLPARYTLKPDPILGLRDPLQ